MKKFLPIFKDTSGFTLVELMVVIAIIGILAVVALGIFSGAQGSARDSRRVAEIDSLAKNIESTRDPLTGSYRYTGGANSLMARDYPAGLADPGDRRYCYAVSTTSTPPNGASSSDPPIWAAGAVCPSVPVQWSIIGAVGGSAPNNTVLTRTGPGNDLTDIDIMGWKVCAVLERSNTVYCKSNTIR